MKLSYILIENLNDKHILDFGNDYVSLAKLIKLHHSVLYQEHNTNDGEKLVYQEKLSYEDFWVKVVLWHSVHYDLKGSSYAIDPLIFLYYKGSKTKNDWYIEIAKERILVCNNDIKMFEFNKKGEI